jgi:hypothetical protein
MPWEFSGDNLVYNAPPETAGYTWKPMGQNENGTNPEGEWVKNEGFDPTTLLNGRVDKYGRLDLTPREDLNAAENRAYQLAYGSVDPNREQFEVKSMAPDFIKNQNLQWWDVDPAYQDWWIREHSQNKGGAIGTGGGLIGMRASEYITPAAILAAPFAIEALAPLSAATAPAYDAAFAFGAGAAPEAVGAGASALSTGEILGSGGFTPTAGSSFAIDPAAAYTAGGSSVADIGMGTNATLQGPTYQELGVTGVPEGGMGPTYAEMGNTGLNTEQAISAADAAAKSSQISEALKTANEVRQAASTANKIAKLLSPTSQTVAKTGTNANSQFINAAQNLAQFTPEQFGGYYQMNKNPFTFSNPMANALAKGSGLDVSGTGGQALNTTNQTANLLRTLV